MPEHFLRGALSLDDAADTAGRSIEANCDNFLAAVPIAIFSKASGFPNGEFIVSDRHMFILTYS